MKNIWIMISVLTLLLVSLFGFIVHQNFKSSQPKIVVVLKDLGPDYWTIMEAGAEKAFRDFGVNGKVLAPERGDPTVQNKMLINVLNQKPDALIVSPIQPSAIVPVLMKFKEKNIPVLSVDTDVEWQDLTAFIGTDNPALGRKAGELLTSVLQPGDKVAIIDAERTYSMVGRNRVKGAKEAFEAAGIKVAWEQAGVDGEKHAKTEMENILRMDPDIKGVFGTNDMLALGALKAAQEKGMKIPVVGADGIWEMVKFVEEGALPGTAAQNPYDMGYQSVENALKAIRGEAVREKTDSGVDIITSDNAKQKLEFLEQISH